MNDSANLFLEKIKTLELQIETLESKVISLEEKNSEYIKEISNRFIKISEKLIILSDKLSAAKEEKFNRDEITNMMLAGDEALKMLIRYPSQKLIEFLS